MKVELVRYSYAATETEGVLIVGEYRLATIERPWFPGPDPGGAPFKSCVPDAEYQLVPFTRPSGEEVYALINPELGVYLHQADRPHATGRYLILIHTGNWVTDVVGCIAPGLKRLPMVNRATSRIEQAVSHSGAAMKKLRAVLKRDQHVLVIRPRQGTREIL